MALNRTRIKMCGMTSQRDINYAMALGVDAIGLIFYPKSKRFISLQNAKVALSSLPLFVDVVAVMVNPIMSDVKQIIDELPINILQFHGDESADFCRQFNKPYIKALSATTMHAISLTMNEYHDAAAILVDTPSLTEKGGTGKSFNWCIVPSERDRPLILAGGLTPSNVCLAIDTVKPYAVDVCSGIELSSGVKDPIKMMEFVNAVNN